MTSSLKSATFPGERLGSTERPERILACFPAFNEAGKIGTAVRRVPPGVVDEIVVIDDGSTDATVAEAQAAGATVIRNAGRSGVGFAILRGLDHAVAHGFSIVVILAGNNKDDPAEIPRLVAPILEEGYHFVQGSRYLAEGRHGGMPLYRRLATRYLHPLLFSLVAGRRITDSTNGFRAFRTSILEDARIDLRQPWLRHYELEPYLFLKVIRLGYRVKEVPVTKIYPPRRLGYTKMAPITGWWSILRPLLYVGLGLRK
ncbi:MAG: glycosyltransferase family 2 protein [Deltaproteobacteria bacterium]|nr:MAG: glycosyltransferase family 2 protein [Deltaproteobacteria bacterium]